MARLRCVVTLPWTSALPEDVTINVFHFLTNTTPSTLAEQNAILSQWDIFYNTSSGVAGDALSGFMSNLVSRTAGACTAELFDLADAEPRIPINSTTFTMAAPDAASSAPTEAACCLSIQGAPVSGIPQARRRGRLFIGPFISGAAGVDGRPTAALVGSISAAGNNLLDTLQGVSPVRWMVYSRLGDAMAEVVDGWVDNEWDTMRSRGRRATTRTTFT